MALDLNLSHDSRLDKAGSAMGRYYSETIETIAAEVNSRGGGLLLEEDQFRGFNWDPEEIDYSKLL